MTQYEQLYALCGGDFPASATNEHGEPVIIERGCNDHGAYIRTTTAQHNDWCRINHYYENGDSEETYEK